MCVSLTIGSYYESRLNEYKSVLPILKKRFKNKQIIIPNKSVKLEGGDIIQNNEVIFIGIGKRTNKKGLSLIKSISNKKIYEINHSTIHLDCCLVLLKNNIIVYTKKYIKYIPNVISKKFNLIV